MRILYLTPAFPPCPGGGERFARSLGLALAAAGYDMTVLTSDATTESALWQGTNTAVSPQHSIDNKLHLIRCSIAPMPGGWRALLAWRKSMVVMGQFGEIAAPLLRRLANRLPRLPHLTTILYELPRPDLVHGFNLSWEGTLVAGWQAAQAWDIPFVVTPFAHFGGGKRDRVALNNTMPHQRQLLNDATVLTLTDVEAANLRRYGVQTRFETIGGGLDPIPPLPEVTAVPPPDPPYACFVGRASADKGAIHALQAVAAVNQARSQPLTLVFIGQRTPELDTAVKQLPPAAQTAVRLLGRVSEADKHALLSGCEMLLLPSRTDSFGIVFLEAWAHGKPVIGANAGGIPGVVDDGKNGLLVPFGDVAALADNIRLLLAQPNFGRRLGENGRAKVAREYNWQQVGQKVSRIYRSLT